MHAVFSCLRVYVDHKINDRHKPINVRFKIPYKTLPYKVRHNGENTKIAIR